MKVLLAAQDLTKSFGSTTVLSGVSLSVDAGETVALTGESGSGKSTLIYLLAGLDVPDSGTVEFDGQNISDFKEADRANLRRTSIGIVFQQFNLIPSLSAGENVDFQAKLAGVLDRSWADHVAHQLGIQEHLAKYPEELSGGQQQRVAIARALAAKPKLILADEPTGNLDEALADKTLDILKDLVVTASAGLIMATHSKLRAQSLDQNVHLSHGVLS